MLQNQHIFVGMPIDSPLRRWRRQQGLTQGELAERCGVALNTITRYERGRHVPRGEQLERLIAVTGLSADALVRPTQFLQANPTFLAEFAEIPKRGRPTRGAWHRTGRTSKRQRLETREDS